jgi:hypothetical protein
VAQCIGPEFKPQYHPKKKKKIHSLISSSWLPCVLLARSQTG